MKAKLKEIHRLIKKHYDILGYFGLLYLSVRFIKTKYDFNNITITIFILSSILILKSIVRFDIITKLISKLKIMISLLLLAIVVYRLLHGNIFDYQSVLSVFFATLLLIIPDISELIFRIKKIKVGNLEFEISEKIKELNENVESLENKISIPKSSKKIVDEYSKISEEILNSSTNPRLIIMHQASEIERVLRKLHDSPSGKTGKERPLSAIQQVNNLVAISIIDQEIIPIFKEFYSIRNQIVHGRSEEINENTLYQIIDIGQKILKILMSPRTF